MRIMRESNNCTNAGRSNCTKVSAKTFQINSIIILKMIVGAFRCTCSMQHAWRVSINAFIFSFPFRSAIIAVKGSVLCDAMMDFVAFHLFFSMANARLQPNKSDIGFSGGSI